MKNIKLFGAVLAALAGLASVHAQIAVAQNDLILGFKVTDGGTGATNSLEVNLGTASNLVSLSGGAEYTLSQVSVLDIAGTYQSDDSWKRGGVAFAVAGTSGATTKTLWGSLEAGAVAATPGTGTQQNTPVNNINSLYSSTAGGLGTAGVTATANSGGKAAVITGGPANSWDQKSGNGYNFGFNKWSSPVIYSTTEALNTSSFVALDLYEYLAGAPAATLLGTFKLYDTGSFSFTSLQAIPEPSTYAALLGVVTLGVVAIRRRRQAALEV